MIKTLLYLLLFSISLAQEFLKMKDFVKANKEFELAITTKSESYTDGFLNNKDSLKTEYYIQFMVVKGVNYTYSVLLKQESEEINQKNKRMLPKFSEVYMTFDEYGKLVDLTGLELLENKFHVLMNQLIEERGLANNESAQYLKYIVSNPEILQTIYFSNVVTFFQFFKKGLLANLGNEERIKLKNPINRNALNALQIKKIKKTKENTLLTISQSIKNHDITQTMQQISKNDELFVQYLLNYNISLSYLAQVKKQIPKRLHILRSVKINNQDKTNYLEIQLNPVLK